MCGGLFLRQEDAHHHLAREVHHRSAAHPAHSRARTHGNLDGPYRTILPRQEPPGSERALAPIPLPSPSVSEDAGISCRRLPYRQRLTLHVRRVEHSNILLWV